MPNVTVDAAERLDLIRDVIDRAGERLCTRHEGEAEEDVRAVVQSRLRAVVALLEDVVDLLN